MKTSFKFATLAALTAATLALPAAAQNIQGGAKCKPKTGMSKCCGKYATKCCAKSAKCKAKKCAPKCSAACAAQCSAKCAAQCAPVCAPKCAPNN